MSFWELLFVRNQNTLQQHTLNGARTNSARFESAAQTALSAAAQWQQLSERQDRRIAELTRELGREMDENDEMRRTLRALRQQQAELAAADAKLLRERHVLTELASESVSHSEARNRLVRVLYKKIGESALHEHLGATATEYLAVAMTKLADDAEWQQTRSDYIADEIARRLKQLEQTPAADA